MAVRKHAEEPWFNQGVLPQRVRQVVELWTLWLSHGFLAPELRHGLAKECFSICIAAFKDPSRQRQTQQERPRRLQERESYFLMVYPSSRRRERGWRTLFSAFHTMLLSAQVWDVLFFGMLGWWCQGVSGLWDGSFWDDWGEYPGPDFAWEWVSCWYGMAASNILAADWLSAI